MGARRSLEDFVVCGRYRGTPLASGTCGPFRWTALGTMRRVPSTMRAHAASATIERSTPCCSLVATHVSVGSVHTVWIRRGVRSVASRSTALRRWTECECYYRVAIPHPLLDCSKSHHAVFYFCEKCISKLYNATDRSFSSECF